MVGHPENDSRLVVPDLRRIWEAFVEGLLRSLGGTLTSSKELFTTQAITPSFQKTQLRNQKRELAWFYFGLCREWPNAPDTHLTSAKAKWLNLDKNVVRFFSSSEAGIPQILLNYAPVDRDIWRLKAYLDSVGRPSNQPCVAGFIRNIRPIN